jgi:hypothetical protein
MVDIQPAPKSDGSGGVSARRAKFKILKNHVLRAFHRFCQLNPFAMFAIATSFRSAHRVTYLGPEITSGVTTTRARNGWHRRGAPRHTACVAIHVIDEGALFFREERRGSRQLEPSRG